MIGKLLVNKLNISEDGQVIFWNTYKRVVNQVLCKKRNNINGAVKISFIGNSFSSYRFDVVKDNCNNLVTLPILSTNECSLTLLLHCFRKKMETFQRLQTFCTYAQQCELGVHILCQHHLAKNSWPHQVERTGNKKDYFTDSNTNG